MECRIMFDAMMAAHHPTTDQVKDRKSRPCEAGHCNETQLHLFKWPSDGKAADKWTSWVCEKRANFKQDTTSVLCYRHFTDDAFSNLGQYRGGFATVLKLERTAIPTVHMTAPTKQQKLHGVNLSNQDASPSKRTGQSSTEREKRVLCRSEPSDISASAAETVKQKQKKFIRANPKRFRLPIYKKPPVLHGRSYGVQAKFKPKKVKYKSQRIQCFGFAFRRLSVIDEHLQGADEPEAPHSSSPVDPSDTEDPNSDSDDEWIPEEEDDEDDEFDEMKLPRDSRHGKWFGEPKYIVSETNLLQLMRLCVACGGEATPVKRQQKGGYVEFSINCLQLNCGHEKSWESTPTCNQTYVINLLLSAAILFAGGLGSQFIRFFSYINIQAPSLSSFYRHQRQYLHGVIRSVYTSRQQVMVDEIKNEKKKISLAGDGRADSPGHSALFGIYSLLDCDSGKVLMFELVKCTEVSSSNAMELEGLIRCRNNIDAMGVPVQSVTTDRHLQIQAYMRKSWSEVEHFYDTWHISKGLKKKLTAIAVKKPYAELAKWIKSITNHLYWVVDTTDPNSPLRREMWLSIIDHIANIHCFDSVAFPTCEHDDLEGDVDVEGNPITRAWILEGTPTHREMKPLIADNNLLKAIDKAGKENTSELESFHSMVNRYAPKMLCFSYSGMLSRVQLCILHHNENCQRPIITNKDGTVRYRIVRKKATKLQPTITTTRVAPKYGYITELMVALERHICDNSRPNIEEKYVPSLSSKGPQIAKEELINTQKSRGLKKKPHYLEKS